MADFDKLDEATFERTRRQSSDGTPRAIAARYDKRNERIVVRLDNDFRFSFDPRRVQGLVTDDLQNLTGVLVQGTGSTLHFPRLDADFSVLHLLERFLGPLNWTEREAPTSTSREKGRRGGRPKRVEESPR